MGHSRYGNVEQDRFRARILHWSVPEPNTGCWLWTGAVCPTTGYARMSVKKGVVRGAHAVSYSTFIGTIPAGMVLDHKCRVRCCVNPSHLEPVTQAENVLRGIGRSAENARKEICVRGHSLTDERNVSIRCGRRVCRACKRDEARRRYHQRRKTAVTEHPELKR